MDKQQFLSRVRDAVGRAESPISNLTFEWRPLASMKSDRAALVERFVKELAAVGGNGLRVAEATLLDTVWEIANERNAKCVALGSEFGDEAIKRLRDSGLEIETEAARADFGLSEVECAIAETGTVVLTSGTNSSRLATVLPPRYFAIVRAEQIAPNFSSAIETLRKKYGSAMPAAITLVTGPSRTADIELSLTIGVHGPGEMIALIVD